MDDQEKMCEVVPTYIANQQQSAIRMNRVIRRFSSQVSSRTRRSYLSNDYTPGLTSLCYVELVGRLIDEGIDCGIKKELRFLASVVS